jgi:predicted DNA-binding transcriptional regulator AlpA
MPYRCRLPTLLDTPAAANVLGIGRRTLEDWRRRGTGPPFVRLSATRVRYSLDALVAWLGERTTMCTSLGSSRERTVHDRALLAQDANPDEAPQR